LCDEIVNGMACFAGNIFLPTVQGARISKILRQSSQDVKSEGGTELSEEPALLPELPTNGRLAEHHPLSWKTVLTKSEYAVRDTSSKVFH
jgi:hypothetical protein